MQTQYQNKQLSLYSMKNKTIIVQKLTFVYYLVKYFVTPKDMVCRISTGVFPHFHAFRYDITSVVAREILVLGSEICEAE